ncbi:hypothetical protein SAMN05660742_111134 [Propionispira arboris]|uniref:Putative tail fiber protein gp53-like C-terminal domain-containing protein n=1 Tax=Propionispira arboris TaxID=84035 RepID=A0A1H7A901_9FIRM|nr:hypothetical protein [Propionispira arboris]SEJ60367.1 hypothetical protein SAMN05660742_111134 [Propionispira arboris]
MAYDKNFPANDGFLAEFPEKQRAQIEAIINDAIVNAKTVQNLDVGNDNGNIPVANGTECNNLNAGLLNGKMASDMAPKVHGHDTATPSSDGFLSNVDKKKLDTIAENAQVNQNVFADIKIGDLTLQPDAPDDTLEFVAGTNIALTPDTTNDKVTIAITGKVATAAMADNATKATNADVAARCTGNAATATTAAACSGNAATATSAGTLSVTLPISKGGTGATTAAAVLTALGISSTATELNHLDGITATLTELNYVDGVTSPIQTQINAKAPVASPTFTGKVTASSFSGALSGNAATASNASLLNGSTAAQLIAAAGGVVAQNLGVNGYVKFFNGFIVQWGRWKVNSGWNTKTAFPIGFKNACLSVNLSVYYANGTPTSDLYYTSVGIKYFDETGIYAGTNSTDNNCFYIVVGW